MSENFQPTVNTDRQSAEGDPAPAGDDGEQVTRWNDATVCGVIDPALLARRLTVAFGRNKEDKHWKNLDGTIQQLLDTMLTKFERGAKDGRCMLQGALVEGASQRVAKNMQSLSVIMFDHDTGESMDEIIERLTRAGLFALLWTTWSHLRPETDVAEATLLKWMKENGRSGKPDLSAARGYLLSVKGYKPEILEGAELGARKQVPSTGFVYPVKHKPLPRIRSLILLDRPFVVADRGVPHKEALDEWSELYAGTATMLGLPFDRSCTDASRLMYTPRIPAPAQIGEGAHEIVILSGKPLNLDTVPRVKSGRTAGDQFSAFKDGGSKTGKGHEFKTKNLSKFLAVAAKDFEAADWAQSVEIEPRYEHSDGMDCACPNEDGHTTPKPDDRAFSIRNASGNTDGTGFRAWCLHEGCKAASGGDRAWYLDLLCQQAGVEDAMDLIRPEWTPTVWAAQEAERKAAAEEAAKAAEIQVALAEQIKEALAAVKTESTVDEIQTVMMLIAQRPESLQDESDLAAIKRQTGWGTKTLRSQLTRCRKETAGEKVNKRAGGRAPESEGAPIPDDLGTAQRIYTRWGHNTVVDATLARLAKLNAAEPTLFRDDAGGGVCRIEGENGCKVVRQMKHAEWHAELSQRVTYRHVFARSGQEQDVAISRDALNAVMGKADKPFPPLDRITHLPVFAPDGNIQWGRGYDEKTRTYLDPQGVDWLRVPDTPSEAELDEAVGWVCEAIKDFPFSDAMDGSDQLPVKDPNGKANARGYRPPNYDRGQSSRANAVAMILQHFARDMIDGPCPGYLIDKGRPGEGAGYLANVESTICEGSPATARPLPADPSDIQKAVLAAARERAGLTFWDNINHKVDSGPLAAGLTSQVYADRVLHTSDAPKVPMRGVWVFAGVQVKMSDELQRRMVPIRLDAAVPRPENRPSETFDHYPLQGWLLENRQKLVWACHVIIKHWVACGRPDGAGHLASFPEYASAMSGILECAGIEGFLGNVDAYREAAQTGETGDPGEALVQALWNRHGPGPFGADDILIAIDKMDDGIELACKGHPDYRVMAKAATALLAPCVGRTYSVSVQAPETHASVPETHAGAQGDSPETHRLVKVVRQRDRNPVRFALVPLTEVRE